MKEKIDIDIYLEKRLGLWALWCITPKGWASASLIAIMLEVGAISNSTFGSREPVGLANHLAEEINTWINRMKAQRPEYADALRAYYIEKRKGKKIKELANDRKISVRTLDQRVQHAKNWLMGAVSNDPYFNDMSKKQLTRR
jgi:hypothetical protein